MADLTFKSRLISVDPLALKALLREPVAFAIVAVYRDGVNLAGFGGDTIYIDELPNVVKPGVDPSNLRRWMKRELFAPLLEAVRANCLAADAGDAIPIEERERCTSDVLP